MANWDQESECMHASLFLCVVPALSLHCYFHWLFATLDCGPSAHVWDETRTGLGRSRKWVGQVHASVVGRTAVDVCSGEQYLCVCAGQ